MIPVTIEIKGLSEAQRALEAMPEHVAQHILAGALRAGATVIRTACRDTAPVGYYADSHEVPPGHRRVGSLLENIKLAQISKQGLAITYGVGVGKAFWGMFDEFGTRHQPARPWMRPAWDISKEAATARFQQVLGDGIEAEAESMAFHKSGTF